MKPEESLDLKLVSRLVRIMQRGDVTELELDDSKSGVRVRLQRGSRELLAAGPPVVHMLPSGAPLPALAPAPAAEAAAASSGGPPSALAGTVPFTSPMVGTFYKSPAPDADPFVSPGSQVDAETVLCIIEAMKVMNEIKAELSGEIVQTLVENGEPVEFGQPLFLIRTR